MVVALFVVGFAFSSGQVLWGTLLQRRVPTAMLGRVSSLDFFVSLALMPVSMALAGPVAEAIGLAPAFLVAGLVPVRAGRDRDPGRADAGRRDRPSARRRSPEVDPVDIDDPAHRDSEASSGSNSTAVARACGSHRSGG